jgi:hypothetical protein
MSMKTSDRNRHEEEFNLPQEEWFMDGCRELRERDDDDDDDEEEEEEEDKNSCHF